MSVYIQGMQAPESCFCCPMRRKIDPDTIECIVTGERFEETFSGTIFTRNKGNCPIIPVTDGKQKSRQFCPNCGTKMEVTDGTQT